MPSMRRPISWTMSTRTGMLEKVVTGCGSHSWEGASGCATRRILTGDLHLEEVAPSRWWRKIALQRLQATWKSWLR